MQGKVDQMRMKMDWTMYAINSMKNVCQEDRDFSRGKKMRQTKTTRTSQSNFLQVLMKFI